MHTRLTLEAFPPWTHHPALTQVVICGASIVSHLSVEYVYRQAFGQLSALDGLNNVLNCVTARDIKVELVQLRGVRLRWSSQEALGHACRLPVQVMESVIGAIWILAFDEDNAVRIGLAASRFEQDSSLSCTRLT